MIRRLLRPLCWIGLHVWLAMKWGGSRLDCRSCRRCGRFEVYAFGEFRDADRARYPDAGPA